MRCPARAGCRTESGTGPAPEGAHRRRPGPRLWRRPPSSPQRRPWCRCQERRSRRSAHRRPGLPHPRRRSARRGRRDCWTREVQERPVEAVALVVAVALEVASDRRGPGESPRTNRLRWCRVTERWLRRPEEAPAAGRRPLEGVCRSRR
jgi:hypothetical protein